MAKPEVYTPDKIPLGISSCLLGHKVRFDTGHKHNPYITGTLGEYFEFTVQEHLSTDNQVVQLTRVREAKKSNPMQERRHDNTSNKDTG